MTFFAPPCGVAGLRDCFTAVEKQEQEQEQVCVCVRVSSFQSYRRCRFLSTGAYRDNSDKMGA